MSATWKNIGFRKMNGDVAVGVSGGVVLEGNGRPVELHGPFLFKDFSGNCSGGPRHERKVPALDSRRTRKVLSRIRVSQNNCARRMHPFVAIVWSKCH